MERNTEQLIKNFIDETRSLYNKSKISKDEIRVRMQRANSILGKWKARVRMIEKRKEYLARATRHLGLIRTGLEQNAKFLGIDTEFHPDTHELYEAGLTFFHNGTFQIKVLIVEGHEDKCRIVPGITYEVLPLKEVRNQVQQHYNEADYVVFHTAFNDREVLELNMNSTRFFDTSYLSHLFERGASKSLSTIANQYDIYYNDIHTSGIDSLMTVEVMIKMASDPRKPYLF